MILFCNNQNMRNMQKIYGEIRTHCVSFNNNKRPFDDSLVSPRSGGVLMLARYSDQMENVD